MVSSQLPSRVSQTNGSVFLISSSSRRRESVFETASSEYFGIALGRQGHCEFIFRCESSGLFYSDPKPFTGDRRKRSFCGAADFFSRILDFGIQHRIFQLEAARASHSTVQRADSSASCFRMQALRGDPELVNGNRTLGPTLQQSALSSCSPSRQLACAFARRHG